MDDYLDSVESTERVFKRWKELAHLPHLVGLKLINSASNVPNLADRIDGSPQPIELKFIASSVKESACPWVEMRTQQLYPSYESRYLQYSD